MTRECKIERLEQFFNAERTTAELKELTTRLIDVVDDDRTIERIWWSAVFFMIYGVVGEEGQEVLAKETAQALLEELLK